MHPGEPAAPWRHAGWRDPQDRGPGTGLRRSRTRGRPCRGASCPSRTSSGVPMRSPLTSPSTDSIGSPIPQASRLARRSRFAARAGRRPRRCASSANWCERVGAVGPLRTPVGLAPAARRRARRPSRPWPRRTPCPAAFQSSIVTARAAALPASKFAVRPGKAMASSRWASSGVVGDDQAAGRAAEALVGAHGHQVRALRRGGSARRRPAIRPQRWAASKSSTAPTSSAISRSAATGCG